MAVKLLGLGEPFWRSIFFVLGFGCGSIKIRFCGAPRGAATKTVKSNSSVLWRSVKIANRVYG